MFAFRRGAVAAQRAPVFRQPARSIMINGRYYDPFHPLHTMGALTVLISFGCVKMIIERRERVKQREEYERQLHIAMREEEDGPKTDPRSVL